MDSEAYEQQTDAGRPSKLYYVGFAIFIIAAALLSVGAFITLAVSQ